MQIEQLLAVVASTTDEIDAGQLAVDGGKFRRGDLLNDLAGVMDDESAIECVHRYLAADPGRRRPPAEMTLKGELRVARAIPASERDVAWLSWSCYRELAALGAMDRREVYEAARREGAHTVSAIRLIIAQVLGAPEADPMTDVMRYPLPQAVRIELRRYYAGRYSDEDIDEFCDQYERIRAEVERAQAEPARSIEVRRVA